MDDRCMSPLVEGRSVTEAYWQDGAVCIPGALADADFALAKELFAWSREHPGQAAQPLDFGADGSIFIETHNRSARETYLAALAKSGIPALVAAALGVDELWYLGEQIYIKQGRPGPARRPGTRISICRSTQRVPSACGPRSKASHAKTAWSSTGIAPGPRYNHIIGAEADGEPLLLYPTAAEKRPFPDIDAARRSSTSSPGPPSPATSFCSIA